jgi:site-specific recombinase XerD
MAWVKVEGWRAGRAWNADGRLSFYIRRNGKDYVTGASTVAGALAALERFEKTGDAMLPEASAPVFLDPKLAQDFLDASKAKGNSHSWRVNQRQHLDWWQTKIGGRDLRAGHRGAVTIVDIEKALDSATSRRQRIAVIKSLFAHLRRTHRIATAEDPTFGQIAVPPSTRAQDTTDKTIDPKDVAKVCKYLDAEWLRRGKEGRRWADLVRLLAGCGMHVTEAQRFAEGGTVEALPAALARKSGAVAVLAVPLHKTGAPFKVAVSTATKEVAARVRKAGSFSIAEFYRALREAAKKPEDGGCGATVLPGRFRHTVARLALEKGATIEEIAAYHRHKDKRTTWAYAHLGVAPKIPTLR